MHTFDHMSLCMCSVISLKHISGGGIAQRAERPRFPQADGTTGTPSTSAPVCPFPHTRYPTLSNTRYHFVLIFANLIGENNTALLLECAFRWFLGRPGIFSYVCGPSEFHLRELPLSVFGEALRGASSLPGGSAGVLFRKQRSPASCRIGLPGRRLWAFRPQQAARAGISRDPVPLPPGAPRPGPLPWPCPHPCSTEARETRSAYRKNLFSPKFQTHPAKTFQEGLLA